MNLEHLRRIHSALDMLVALNRHPQAVDEPTNDFETAVNEWFALQRLQEEIKSLMKPVDQEERTKRDALAASLRAFYGENLKEGVNNYELSNHRVLKFENKVKREIDASALENAKDEYEKAPTPGVLFTDLLRVKYELEKRPYNKLGPASTKAVSHMITSKLEAPTLRIE